MMRVLADRAVRRLFLAVAACILGFFALAAAAVGLGWPRPALWVLGCGAGCAAAAAAALFFYFRRQDRLLEEAAAKIRRYLGGDLSARIDCDQEGELYRLFHEVNSLAAILSAHAENEGRSKVFLKDTISNISHQLKTPLAALNIYNGLLQQEARDLPAVKKFADLSEQELDHIEALVQSLLKMARLDSGAIVLEKAEENVAELMECVQRRFACRARQEEKQLVLSGDEAVTLPCDRGWLLEAVGNLVKNAFDHTGAGDVIRVEWRRSACMVQIAVRDSGSGIAPEDMPHIFKRFYRSRFSKDTQGVGLGLPLAKAVVEAHSGTIEADSEPGRGTVFTMNFLIPAKL